jgi:purine-binding chemotaxis protein CheW
MEQFCTFYLDTLFCGIEVKRIQEVLRWQPMTQVPLSPPVIRGLINLRGQIVTAIDMRRRLELTDFNRQHKPTNILVRADSGVVSLMVDDVADVMEVDLNQQERPPETLRGPAREVIRGAFKLEHGLLLILDIDQAAAVFTSLHPSSEATARRAL